jgi:GDSL-like Lipase/Acylhydrolase family
MLKKVCLAAGSGVLLFLIIEGICSGVLAAHHLWSSRSRRSLSGPSMKYDGELGWVSVPNFFENNYYAPGVYLKTNSQGFRAREDFEEQVPPGRLRMICSGDSFTFGEGVDNDHTWCQYLESIDGRLQTVNMAMSGYGVDQMYMWYMRKVPSLHYDVQVVAFITEDFRRMQLTSLVGYGKPVLKLQNGELVTENVPVPRQSRFVQWIGSKSVYVRELNSIKLLGSLVGRILPGREVATSSGPSPSQAQILDKMIETLQETNRRKNSVLVFVYLPTTLHDYEQDEPAMAWQAWIRAECARRGVVFVDLVDDFQKLPLTMRDGMFICPHSVHYFAEAPGHYNDQGHEYVAKQLYARLVSIPEVAAKLNLHSEDRIAKRRTDSSSQSSALAMDHRTESRN